MKQILSFVLIALVASMVVGLPATFADSKLDSLVNIATKARSQVQFQLERTPNVSDGIKALFEQGSQETELLISAVGQGDVAQAKQHYLAAMKMFKQVTVGLSEPPQVDVAPKPTPPQTFSTPQFNYKNDIDRAEKYVRMLKDLATKNSFSIDFSRIDALIQNARSALANNDISSVEKIHTELKSALAEIQNSIKEQTEQRQNNRVRAFVTTYVAKIDAIIAQAQEMDLSEETGMLVKAKEEIVSITDPNLIIVKIRQLDSVLKEIETHIQTKKTQTTNTQEVRTEESRPTEPPAETQESKTEEPPVEQKSATESKQEQLKKETKKVSGEVLKLEARLDELKPYVDENIASKFGRAETLLSKLKNQETTSFADYNRTLRMLDLLIDGMEQYVESLQDQQTDTSSENSESNQETKNRPSEKPKKHSDRNN